jgi:hypothetical protein
MKFIELPDKAKGYEDIIKESIALRVRANKMKDEAKGLEEQANDLFRGVADIAGFDAVETTLGTIQIVNKTTSSLDKNKLKDLLIKAGVESDVVAKSFDKAMKTSETSYVGFFPPKGE